MDTRAVEKWPCEDPVTAGGEGGGAAQPRLREYPVDGTSWSRDARIKTDGRLLGFVAQSVVAISRYLRSRRPALCHGAFLCRQGLETAHKPVRFRLDPNLLRPLGQQLPLSLR